MAITPGLVKGPADNWVPVTKSLLHALVPMASPFPIPGPESLGQHFAWDVVCASQRWEMSLKSQLSDHSPAFSSMTDAHPLSDLAGSQMPPDFPWLAPHAPVLGQNCLVSWSLTTHVNGSLLQTLRPVCTSEPPHLAVAQSPSPCVSCGAVYSWVSGAVRSCKITVTDLGRSRQLCYLSSLCLEKNLSDNYWEPTVLDRELYLAICGDINRKETQKRGDICTWTADSLCSTVGTNIHCKATILW